MTTVPPLTPAAIAAGSSTTAAAGARIAREGGNAVDIAVASALAATLAESLMCSIGGSGFMMIRRAGREPELIDGLYDLAPVPGEVEHEVDSAALAEGDDACQVGRME